MKDKFFLYDPEGGGFQLFEAEGERDDAAAAALNSYLDSEGNWEEEYFCSLCVGVITAVPQQVDRVNRPSELELDEENCDKDGTYWGEFEYMCRYELKPLTPPNIGVDGEKQ